MILPTASQLALAMECTHSFTSGLPWPKETDTGRFAFGNAAHDAAEAFLISGSYDLDAIARARDLAASERHRLAATVGHVTSLIESTIERGCMIAAELPLAYNVKTRKARIMKRKNHRDYSDRRPFEFTGTLDVVAVESGKVAVLDWKTGAPKWTDEAVWQMKYAGLAAAKLVGASEVSTALLYVDEDGIKEDVHHLDAFDMAEAADRLDLLWDDLHKGPTPPVPGVHCTANYCKLAGVCSATRAALAETVASRSALIATEEDAARVWAMLPQAEAAIKAAKEQIRHMAYKKPIPLLNGKRLAIVEQSRETIELDAHTAALVPDAAREFSTSKAAIEAALGKAAGQQLIASLRAAGAVREKTYQMVKEVKGTEA